MAFNSGTYHANKWAREAKANLAAAREIKDRAAKGEAYDWEVARIATFVKLARSSNRLSIIQRRINGIGK